MRSIVLIVLATITSVTSAQDRDSDLEQADKREFAFLEAQARSLEQRLGETEKEGRAMISRLENEIRRTEDRLLGLQSRADTLEQLVLESERALQADEDNSEVLEATYMQAESTLKKHAVAQFDPQAFAKLDDQARIPAIFDHARQVVDSLDDIRTESGKFYLNDGAQTGGSIIYVGGVAAYGVSEKASGALAPAGDGRFKLWPAAADDVAEAFGAGRPPELLKMFLFEAKTREVTDQAKKTVLSTIQSGGSIAWIIVLLGVVALVLIALRAVFLKSASASTATVIDEIGGLVKSGQIDQALALCKEAKNATARVVAATLRNLDRDREHLEDIVSEAILHESGHLDRFGSFILVSAAVAPLLGLLGTVTGMISTFDVITEFGTGDPKLLSGGISVALVTTEIGLIVAIPTLLIGNLLSGWAERIKDDMEKAALRITNIYQDARSANA